jgi:hypothetical protein
MTILVAIATVLGVVAAAGIAYWILYQIAKGFSR